MLCKELVRVVRGPRVGAAAVEMNHVDRPVTVVDVLEQRRVTAHLYEVGVLLHAHHVGGIIEHGEHVAAADTGVGREFADVEIPALPLVRREAVEVLDPPVQRLVGVLVDDIDLPRRVDDALVDAGDPGAQCDLQLRILRLDRLVEHCDPLTVTLATLLVADLDVLQRERRRMAVLRAHGAPLRRSRANGILDRIECILDQTRQSVVFEVSAAAHRARHADIDDEESVGAEVLAELQELVVAEAVRRPVTPRTIGACPILQASDRALPLRTAVDVDPFRKAAARPPDEPRLEIRNHLREIGAKTVRAIAPRLGGKQRDEIEAECAGGPEVQREPCLGIARLGGQRNFEFLPLRPEVAGDRRTRQLVAVRAFEPRSERAREAMLGAGIETQLVARTCLDVDAPEPLVPQRHFTARRNVLHFDQQGMRRGLRQWHGIGQPHRGGASGSVQRPCRRFTRHVPAQPPVVRLSRIEMRRARRHHESVLELAHGRQPRVFEAAVLDQLGIQATLPGVRDLFEEDPVQVRGDRVSRLVGINRHSSRRPGAGPGLRGLR